MCRNCQVICWERREDREENRRLLMNSGIVMLTPEGKRTAVPQEQAAEVETSRLVRVAVPHQDAGTVGTWLSQALDRDARKSTRTH